MPYNGSGTFTPLSPEYPAIPNTTIYAGDYNAILADLAAALSMVITRDGQAPATANISFGGFQVKNIADGILANDAVSVQQLAVAVANLPAGALLNGLAIATQAFVLATAFNSALPLQTGNAGKFVTTDGTNASWASPLPAQANMMGKVLGSDGANASWVSAFPPQAQQAGNVLTSDGNSVSWQPPAQPAMSSTATLSFLNSL